WTPDDVKRRLEACDRAACGPVAPACGLYFVEALYQSA
ncbi:MAG: tRNA pseudouridine(38-40) synthase TruA, partial [Pseudomonadota bacterium]